MLLQSGTIDIPEGTGQRTIDHSFTFPRRISTAYVALTGFSARYTDSDHHVALLAVQLEAVPRDTEFGQMVVVTARFHLRDKNDDDRYSGRIDLVVFAEPEGFRPPIDDRPG
jgi:hypothetical protein